MTLLIFTLFATLPAYESVQSEISKRFLIFPQAAPTRHQFIAGIGIPADPGYESLTVGYVFKAEFFLPYNATTFRRNPFIPEYTQNDDSETRHNLKTRSIASRWNIYAAVTEVLERNGYNGENCLLLAICESQQFGYNADFSIFAELLRIFLTPSASNNGIVTEDIEKYLYAEELGRKFDNDDKACKQFTCESSFLQKISIISNYL